MEHAVRLAAIAASRQQWDDVSKLLAPLPLLLRTPQRPWQDLPTDVSRARELVQELVSGKAEGGGSVTAIELRQQELLKLLSRWTFNALFEQLDNAAFLQASTGSGTPAADARTLWKQDGDRLLFATTAQNGITGFIDTARETGRCLIRFEMLSGSNSAGLVFGAGRESDLRAWILALDATGPGRIQRLPGGATVLESPVGAQRVSSGRQQVEILLDGNLVVARVDGVAVVQTTLPELSPGRLGLIVPLQRPDGGPRLEVRRARILQLPETSR